MSRRLQLHLEVRLTYLTTLRGVTISLAVASLLALSSLPLSYGSSLDLTLASDRQIYDVGERITIDGNLTLDGNPVSDGLITVQVNDQAGVLRFIRTVPTGTNLSRAWSVEILAVVPVGGLEGQPTQTFLRGSYVGFNVTVQNNDFSDHGVTIALSTFYSNDVPFSALIMWNGTLNGQERKSIMFNPLIQIPENAPIGTAYVHANALTPSLPDSGGFAYGPERSATFQITADGASSVETQSSTTTLGIASSSDGAYNVTFRTPTTNAILGNYTVYATTLYPEPPFYFTSERLTFEVSLTGDLTGPQGIPDGSVDIRDIVLVAFAYGTIPGDPAWNPIVDLYPDLKIDIRDIVIVALNYGKSGYYP